ncbi:epoxide hydrolase family protein [Cellulomonas endophytica]|uniref:epoxide hydrolase family protein n=1 Tax=Cellulomonas endophytica TaxID=2494735 RepID=UPI001011CABA|nr:epoxide hydrolase family protein [Cellulomonas endophytica]
MQRIDLPRTDDAALDDLAERLARTRSVPHPVLDRSLGVDPALLAGLLERWRDGFDWRAQEERIAALPWHATERTEVPVRAVVHRAAGDAPAVLLLHGWPDSVLRFERVLPHLDDLTWVAPALPGFPFAAPVPGGGLSSRDMADAVAAAMAELGVDRYVVSAGDVGCDVAEALAARHPGVVEALHLTDVSQYHFLVDPPADLDDEEREYVARGHRWQAAEGGYMHEQSTRPGTLAVGLGDSPAGLAAWLVEKLVRWTDPGDDLGSAFTHDEALTWVTAYWLTGSIGTSFTPYAAGGAKDWPPVEVPTVVTMFAHDLVNAPRRFAERFFDVVDWRDLDHGGHFAAWERPEDYVWGIRRAIEVRRPAGETS